MRTSKLLVLAVVLATVFLVGCASSQPMSALPAIGDEQKSATVYVFRPSRFSGDALAGHVYLDDRLIFKIAVGDYTKFQVSPGRHTIRIMGKGWFDIVTNQVSLVFGHGISYYFKVSNNEIVQLPQEVGEKRVPRLEFFPLKHEK